MGCFVKNWMVCVSLCLLMAACDRGVTPGQAATVDPRPAELRATVERPMGSMCFLQKVNQVAVRARPRLRAGQPGMFLGWAHVADSEHPTPGLVHVVLRPVGGHGTQADIYLEMGRMPRPDLAGNDARREMIGFEGEGTLPGGGMYDVFVSQSNGRWRSLCRTGTVLEIGQ